jgi:hypothetical protein
MAYHRVINLPLLSTGKIDQNLHLSKLPGRVPVLGSGVGAVRGPIKIEFRKSHYDRS